MASIKITQLNEASELDSSDVIPFVDVSADETKKITYQSLVNQKFAVITGNYTRPQDETNPSVNLDYPEGFNKDNCVVISVMQKRPTLNQWTNGVTYTQNSVANGATDNRIILYDSYIRIDFRSLYLRGGSSPEVEGQLYENYLPALDFKIVLMKIS